MHFITRCTECGTLFWVEKDQLKVCDAWVRCGCCYQVFDASSSLQDPLISVGSLLQVSSPPPVSAPDPQPQQLAPDAAVQPALEALLVKQSTDVAGPVADSIQGGDKGGDSVLLDSRQDPVVPEGITASDEPPEPGFVRQARRRAFWRSTGVRRVLLLLALVLSWLLVGQWAFHHRDRLATAAPVLSPWMKQVCQDLGCQLSPVRQLESIVIDSTTLVHRGDNLYAFDMVLKNTAAMALAMPALELTLTRSDNTVMVRRVFLPQELPGTPGLLPANATTTVSLRLSLAAGELPMAGYRALVFYP